MKTAMQELIDSYHLIDKFTDFDTWIANNEKRLLEKEKEQMIGCCLVGYLFEDGEDTNPFELAEKFYNQTYNQNKLFTYCQRQIEGQSICDKQCEHCKEYYAPLENQNK